MPASPCDQLTNSRRRDICTGAAGVPKETRRRYIARWLNDGRLSEDPDNAEEPPAVQSITPSQGDPDPTPSHGPGTELKAMLASIGIEPGPGCPCRDMMRKMDRWGVTGCKEHRGEIVMHVQEQMQGRSWREKLTAAAKATANGLALDLNPLDIPGSLVDEAIRRAEQQL